MNVTSRRSSGEVTHDTVANSLGRIAADLRADRRTTKSASRRFALDLAAQLLLNEAATHRAAFAAGDRDPLIIPEENPK